MQIIQFSFITFNNLLWLEEWFIEDKADYGYIILRDAAWENF